MSNISYLTRLEQPCQSSDRIKVFVEHLHFAQVSSSELNELARAAISKYEHLHALHSVSNHCCRLKERPHAAGVLATAVALISPRHVALATEVFLPPLHLDVDANLLLAPL